MKLKFIDLFSGIGGFRLGLEKAGYECVFSAEIDSHACKMYEENFGENPFCDITQLDAQSIPDFDVLCAGFPCQSFSISGKQKGFYDDTRGTLFFDICRILEEKKPKAFILENVKNLTTHDKGNTLKVMLESLHNLGYSVQFQVLNAKDFGVPQNRERIFLVGNREGKYFDFSNLQKSLVPDMTNFLDNDADFDYLDPSEYTLIESNLTKKQEKSGLLFCGYRNKKIRVAGVRENTEHLSRVHKQPNRIYSIYGIHPTLPSQESSGRFYIYDGENVRKLTLDECYRFMGFPDDFKKVGTLGSLYNRIGNSVCVNVVFEVAKELNKTLKGVNKVSDEKNYLESIYNIASKKELPSEYALADSQLEYVNEIVRKESTNKGVYTALVSSLTYKGLHPEQDVRMHKIILPEGYSGRGFDTKFVTPFLKEKLFLGAMKESGWLTRSLEQEHAFDLNFPGRITPVSVKNAFLKILDDVEVHNASAENYLINIFHKSIKEKMKNNVVIINPVSVEEQLTIDQIIDLLTKHFSFPYSVRGTSILPVIAFYSIYQCLIGEMSRYNGKYLDALASHYSSDRSSGNSGDIVVRYENGDIYEAVEIKYDIRIDEIIISDTIKKIVQNNKLERYYILSTIEPSAEQQVIFSELTDDLKMKHGCQLIINGLLKTIKYYLRLIDSTDAFVSNYVKNLQNHPEIQAEQKIKWNKLVEELA